MSDVVALFVEAVQQITRGQCEIADDAVAVTLRDYRDGEFRIYTTQSRLRAIEQSLDGKSISEDTVVYDDRSYEVLIDLHQRRPTSLALVRGRDDFQKVDAENGLTYRIGSPSPEYLLLLLRAFSAGGLLRELRAPSSTYRMRTIREQAEEIDAYEALRQLVPSVYTLQVESTERTNLSQLAAASLAFVFHLGFNLDVPVVELRFLDEILRTKRITRMRRSSTRDLDVPRRTYNPDLVHHYQMAIATESPPLQYLSFFHIAEHFFEEIYNKDFVESVRNQLTDPGFSYHRTDSIRSLIKMVQKRTKVHRDEFSFNESEALQLTIAKYADIPRLRDAVDRYDSALLSYYATQLVPFSSGDRADLNHTDVPQVVRAIANRIYKTRNAIVHSKSGGRDRYIPFQHDRHLIRELPLLRFLSEQIITKTSLLIGKVE